MMRRIGWVWREGIDGWGDGWMDGWVDWLEKYLTIYLHNFKVHIYFFFYLEIERN